MIKVKKDMTGWIMSEHGVPESRLTVIRQVEDYVRSDGRRESRWLCRCNCGNLAFVIGTQLKSGGVKSCGCLLQENLRMPRYNIRKMNRYDLSGEYGIGYTDDNEEFWFDLADYEKIKDYCWRYNPDGYVVGYDRRHCKHIKLHRLVMDIEDPLIEVDHIIHLPRNEHKIDNRKQNLRIVNRSQNCMNTAIYKNNSSGYRGVSWHSRMQKWLARIQVDGKNIYLGSFTDKEEAHRIYEQAAKEYFGEYKYYEKVGE